MECHRADLGCAVEQSVDESGFGTVQPSRLLQIATGCQCVDLLALREVHCTDNLQQNPITECCRPSIYSYFVPETTRCIMQIETLFWDKISRSSPFDGLP